MSLRSSTAYSGPCFFRPVQFVSSNYQPVMSFKFSLACDSSRADGGKDVNAKYNALDSSKSVVSISTPAIVTYSSAVGNEFPYASLYSPDTNVPLAIGMQQTESQTGWC
jgi:hypothetical protein